MKSLKIIFSNARGFSLVEILIALTILALVGTFVGAKVFDMLREGETKATQIQMQNLSERLNEFRRHCGLYPTVDQGLQALVTKPGGRDCPRYAPDGYIAGGQVPQDAWDEDFSYESDGRTFTIKSLGADRAAGGEGYDADIEIVDGVLRKANQ